MKFFWIKVILACILGVAASAQNDTPQPVQRFPRTLPVAGLPGESATGTNDSPFDISFKGGKPQDLVKALDRARNQSAPVIIPPNAADLAFPPFELRSVTLTELFKALNLLGSNESWSWASSGNSIWVLMKQGQGNNNRQPYAFTMPPVQQPPPAETRVQPIHVGYLLEKYEIKEIISAIETGWRMASQSSDTQGGAGQCLVQPELKFQEEISLLLVKGYPPQINFVNELLIQLGTPLKKDEAARASRDNKEPKK